MDDSFIVESKKALEQLSDDELNLGRAKLHFARYEAEQVMLHVLKYQKYAFLSFSDRF